MDAVAHLLRNYALRTDLALEQDVIKKLQMYAKSSAKLW